MTETVQNCYYDVIAGLSAFECSHEVTLNADELQELIKNEEKKQQNEQEKVNQKDDNNTGDRKRTTVHGYLGGKVDINEATNANYDLSHTLLGGYVPKRQLESLSSIDFAHYFHKSLECESALQNYDFVRENRYRRQELEKNDNQ